MAPARRTTWLSLVLAATPKTRPEIETAPSSMPKAISPIEPSRDWRTAVTRAAEVRLYLDEHDPALIGDESFREGGKDKELLENESTLNRLLNEARDAEATLLDPALADTVWAAVLRPTPAPNARYADEPVIESVPEDAPAPPPEDG